MKLTMNDMMRPAVMAIFDEHIAARLARVDNDVVIAVSSGDRKIKKQFPGWSKNQIGKALHQYLDAHKTEWDVERKQQRTVSRYMITKKSSIISYTGITEEVAA